MDVLTQLMFIMMAIVAETVIEEIGRSFWLLIKEYDEINWDNV